MTAPRSGVAECFSDSEAVENKEHCWRRRRIADYGVVCFRAEGITCLLLIVR